MTKATIHIFAISIMLFMSGNVFPQRHSPWELSIGIMPQEFDKTPFQVAGKYHLKSGFGFRLGGGVNFSHNKKPVDDFLLFAPNLPPGSYDSLWFHYTLHQRTFNSFGFTGIQYLAMMKRLNMFILADFLFSYTSQKEKNTDWVEAGSNPWLIDFWDQYSIWRKITENYKSRRYGIRGGIGVDFELLRGLYISLESTIEYLEFDYYKEHVTMRYFKEVNKEIFGPFWEEFDDIRYTGSHLKINFINMAGLSYRF